MTVYSELSQELAREIFEIASARLRRRGHAVEQDPVTGRYSVVYAAPSPRARRLQARLNRVLERDARRRL